MNKKPDISLLLIEDNPGDARLIQEMLKESGLARHVCTFAENLIQALSLIKSRKFDSIILDLNLPDSAGLETLDRVIRSSSGMTPVIVLTGLDDEATGVSAIERGSEDYLVKGSINAAQLARSIRYAIERTNMALALKNSEQFLRATLDALSSNIAILDSDGVILEVNDAWREFARHNSAVISAVGEGADYLSVCGSDDLGKEFAAGIRAVLSGEREIFQMEYPCHSPDEQRWFRGSVTRFREKNPPRAVVAHENITDRKRAEKKLQSQLDELRRWQEVMIDREERVIELKKEINGLLNELGRQEKYGD